MFYQRASQISVRNSLPGPINYEAERLNARFDVVNSPTRIRGCSFFFASKRGPPRIFFVTARYLFPCVDRVTGLRFLMSRARQERAKLKLLHEGWRSGFKVSFMGTFNSRPTAFESAHWHRMTRVEIVRSDVIREFDIKRKCRSE